MRYLKDDAPAEQAVQAIERAMNDAGVVISDGGGGLCVAINGQMYRMVDVESGAGVPAFPRAVESDKLVLAE